VIQRLRSSELLHSVSSGLQCRVTWVTCWTERTWIQCIWTWCTFTAPADGC